MKVLLWVALLAGGDGISDGVNAYRAGRFEEALRLLRIAEAAAGDDAPAELLYDKALAAVRVGELDEAELAVRAASARGDATLVARADFLLGNVAFARSQRAEDEAAHPEAGPDSLATARVEAETARACWARAAASRPDWPAARRNVERALIQRELVERKQAEIARKKAGGRPKVRPQLRPKPVKGDSEQEGEKPPETKPEAAPHAPQADALSPEQVERLLSRVTEKEREKHELRRARRRAERGRAERDW